MKKTKFGFGLMLGAVLGGVAAMFLTPKTGKENREIAKKKWDELNKAFKTKSKEEIVKEIFGSATKEGKKLYDLSQKELNSRLADLKKKYPNLDKTKYMDTVSEVMDRLKEEKEATTKRLTDLSEFLKSRWDYVSGESKKDLKKVTGKKVN